MPSKHPALAINCLEPAPSSAGQPKKNHTAVQSLLNQAIPNGHSSGKAACAQKIVPTAVARSPGVTASRSGQAARLAQTIQGIKLRQQSHHRRSGSVAEHGGKSKWGYLPHEFQRKIPPAPGPRKALRRIFVSQ